MAKKSRSKQQEKQLDELFVETLKDIYYAEKKLATTLPKMAKAAQSEELSAAFEKHAEETEGQIERLEEDLRHVRRDPEGQDLRRHKRAHRRGQGNHERLQELTGS